ncbi:MAG: hypothetical protein IKB70_00830 [Bacilli bacterium]|nr:hypothetical protein [Bacilli bacterium]
MKTKTHFTRKNFIAIALVYFFVILVLLSALLCDATNPIGLKESANIVKKISKIFSFPDINGSTGAYILLSCVLVYILIFVSALIYEMRLAVYYEGKALKKKWVLIYVTTFFITTILGFGIGLVAQYPYEAKYIGNSFLFLLQAMLVGLLLFAALGSIIFSICSLYINFKHINEPFKFFGGRVKEVEEMEDEREIRDREIAKEQGDLAASFGEGETEIITKEVSSGGGQVSISNTDDTKVIGDKERVFPGLSTIDLIAKAEREKLFSLDGVDLKRVVNQFRNYLAKQKGIYFDLNTLRAFIAGLATTRIIILEGLSGTGKSSLARFFSDFIEEESYFEAVQATWRDRSAILGYFNDFSKTYSETEFLKRLYHSTYRLNHVNVMVLDEVNISRVEYYFADFLSILEYPMDKWKIKIMQLPYDFEAPEHLNDGILKIPHNTWFILTANKDDSTYTITDKVYDRAITINFSNRNESFTVDGNSETLPISYEGLTYLFDDAINNMDNHLSEEEVKNFKTIIDFTYDTFEITFGNRINHQIERFVPVFYQAGGNKNDALDFIFSRKVISKLEGRFEDYIKQGLLDLKRLILKIYGKDNFTLTLKEIDKLLRRL